MALDLDRESCTVFRVSRWENSQWEVKEKGFEKSLGSFNSEKDACSRANDLAQARPGSRVVSEERSLAARR